MEMFSHCRALKSLQLRDNQLDPNMLDHIKSSCLWNSVETLDLAHSQAYLASPQRAVSALNYLLHLPDKSMQTLDFSGNRSGAGLTGLVRLESAWVSTLILDENQLDDSHIDALCQAFSASGKITSLSLQNNRFSEEGKHALRQAAAASQRTITLRL